MSENHQFIEFGDNIVARFKKTVIHALSGYRNDPYVQGRKLAWLLSTPESALTFQIGENGKPIFTRNTFVYDDEVIELYTELDLKSFLRYNQELIESGKLVPYNEVMPDFDFSQTLSDEQINTIAKTKQLMSLRKQLKSIQSAPTIQRILDAVIAEDRPNSIVTEVKSKLNELQRYNP